MPRDFGNLDINFNSNSTTTIHFYSTNISQISGMVKMHNYIFTKLARLLVEVPTRH